MIIRNNVIANYFGQAWRMAMGFAFIPLYIKYLGIESYGLIGIFFLLQAWLGLLDLGVRPALSREMSRFTAGAHDAESVRNLLRSIESFVVLVAVLIAIVIAAGSTWIPGHWIIHWTLPPAAVANAFSLMGVVIAFSLVESMYISCLAGLQRQVLLNALSSIVSTARGLGAVLVLALVSPSISAFFLWQIGVSVVSVVLFAHAVYSLLPASAAPTRISIAPLKDVWRFAGGVTAITFLGLLLTQSDKLLLSRMLSLEAFAHYVLAGTVAGGLYALTAPITLAFNPKFTELITAKDPVALRGAYHLGAQLVTTIVGSAAVVLIVFSRQVLLAWTADPILTAQVLPLVQVLTFGTFLNALMWIPYQMQLAHGWTSLAVKINIVAVSTLLPTIYLAASRFGGIGAAWAWVALNVGYVVIAIHFVHRRILPTEKWRWYLHDIALPMLAALATAILIRAAAPAELGRLQTIIFILFCGACVLATAAAAAADVRVHAAIRIRRLLGR